MWAIRVLSGPQAGHLYPLKPGKSIIGRAPHCEIKINSNSVSKEHATILVTDDKVIITDLNSRNGTFVNGIRVHNQRLNLGDKLGLHDVLLDVLKLTNNISPSQPIIPSGGVYTSPAPAWAGSAALKTYPSEHSVAQAHGFQVPHDPSQQPNLHMAHAPHIESDPASAIPAQQMRAGSLADLANNFRIYIDNVAMPGVYALVKAVPYRYALAGLVALYILIVTALSTVPMVSLTKKSIQQESVRRAKTIARHLAAVNRQAIATKNDLALTTQSADREEGVTAAVILSAKDGSIIAPIEKKGEFSKLPFVNEARRQNEETEAIIDSSNLGVSVPITYYNPELGTQSVAAYAIVLYDMGSLAMNSSQALSLFIENLAIALLIGALLFFFLYKIVEQPIKVLNAQLDDALRDGRDDLQTDYQHPTLESLVSNINSALSRIGSGGGSGGSDMAFAPVVNRDLEAANLIRMLPCPALVVSAIDERVIAANPQFDQLIGGGVNLEGRPLSDIPDPALQENLRDMVPKMRGAAGEIALSEIPFYGNRYEICGQAVMGSSEPAYFVITLNQMEIEG